MLPEAGFVHNGEDLPGPDGRMRLPGNPFGLNGGRLVHRGVSEGRAKGGTARAARSNLESMSA